MPAAVRIGDLTNHGGTIMGPGSPTVTMSSLPAAVAGDCHVCGLPPNAHQPTASIFPSGSATVFIEGKPALRVSDACLCGAMAAIGDPTVVIA